MLNSTRIGILGVMAIIASATVLTGMGDGDGAPRGCDFIQACPTSQMFLDADIDTCMALVPDLKGEVQILTCPDVTCCRIEQTPEPGTPVAIGDHEIKLTAIVCRDEIPVRGGNGNDNSPCNDTCDGAVCTSIGDCFVTLHVFDPNPRLECPEIVAPLQLDANCSITVPDLRNEVTIIACTETSGIEISQDPAPGTVIVDPGTELQIDFFLSEIDSCTVFVPILPYTICPFDDFLSADPQTCTTTMPADYCDSYIQECQLQEAVARGDLAPIYTCHTEPEAGTQLPIGENEVRLIVERCEVVPNTITLGNENCTVVPELSCTFNIYVDGPSPELICPEVAPEIEPLQVSADCTVVVPDLRDLVTVDACPGVEYDLSQFPEAGSTFTIYRDDFLYVDVYLDLGKGTQFCTFEVPLNPIISCPDSPQIISLDENCEAVVPDLTGDVQFADCCGSLDEQRLDINCGEIRVTQDPAAGTPLTQETEVTIKVERCFTLISARGVQGEEECYTLGTCTVVLRPIDDTPPVIANCPGDVTLGADADCLGTIPDLTIPDVTGLAIATDNCTPSDEIVLAQDPPAGTEIGLGDISVTITATDAAGNSATCTVNVFLEENGCLNPPAPEPEPEPQPVPGCDPNNQSLNLLFSLLFHSPVCGATCPITVSMMICGFLAMKRRVRRRRK